MIHNDETIWGKDVQEFRPERWLVDPAQLSSMEHNLIAVSITSPRSTAHLLTRRTVRSRVEILHRQEHLVTRDDETRPFARQAIRLHSLRRKGLDDPERVVRQTEHQRQGR